MAALNSLRTQCCDNLLRHGGYRCVAAACIFRPTVVSRQCHGNYAVLRLECRKQRPPDFPGTADAMQQDQRGPLASHVLWWGGSVRHLLLSSLIEALNRGTSG